MGNTYDLELFRALNEEYREQRLVPKPPALTTASYEEVARRRIATLSKHVDVAGKQVLELGTGRGYTAAQLPEVAGAEHVVGVDIRSYDDWKLHNAERTRFVVGDLASEDLVEPESIDVVVSAVVLEHVTKPIRMLEALHRCLRPDGTAWLYFNLHRGPKASHRYRNLYFPWPHLLFDDPQAAQVLKEEGARGTFAWVNRMTAAHYVQTCAEIGFEITDVSRKATPIDKHIDFYLRFEDKLGRYPAYDLETDFLMLVLRKAPGPVDHVPRLGYLERQRHLDWIVAKKKAMPAPAPARKQPVTTPSS